MVVGGGGSTAVVVGGAIVVAGAVVVATVAVVATVVVSSTVVVESVLVVGVVIVPVVTTVTRRSAGAVAAPTAKSPNATAPAIRLRAGTRELYAHYALAGTVSETRAPSRPNAIVQSRSIFLPAAVSTYQPAPKSCRPSPLVCPRPVSPEKK